jgi:preprotein translocase subunit SecA
MTRNQVTFQVLNAIQDEDENELIERAGYSGMITLATLKAGRGMDVLLDKISLEAGGLHVILTFFADSRRNEEQPIGRGGRQGQPGSSKIILSAEKISPCTTMSDLLEKRKQTEKKMKENHVNRAEMERYCENFRNSFFEKLNRFHQLTEDDLFLNRLASEISQVRVIKKAEIELASLHSKDRPIATEAFRLFTSKDKGNKVNLTPWLDLLKQLGKRVENKVITFWSIKFHQPLEAILGEKQSVQLMKENVSQLFEDHRSEFEKYLDPSGIGMAILLQELTQINILRYFKPPTTDKKKKRGGKGKTKILD